MDMTRRTAFEAMRARKSATCDQRRKKRRALVSTLLVCLGSPSLSCAADAAPFQRYESVDCGQATTYCTMTLAFVPAGKRMEIDNASCYLRMSGDHEIASMVLMLSKEKQFRHELFLAPERDVGRAPSQGEKTTIYSANHSIVAFADGGEQLEAAVQYGAGVAGQFACHISGRLIDA
jgi:hypothetical protein